MRWQWGGQCLAYPARWFSLLHIDLRPSVWAKKSIENFIQKKIPINYENRPIEWFETYDGIGGTTSGGILRCYWWCCHLGHLVTTNWINPTNVPRCYLFYNFRSDFLRSRKHKFSPFLTKIDVVISHSCCQFKFSILTHWRFEYDCSSSPTVCCILFDWTVQFVRIGFVLLNFALLESTSSTQAWTPAIFIKKHYRSNHNKCVHCKQNNLDSLLWQTEANDFFAATNFKGVPMTTNSSFSIYETWLMIVLKYNTLHQL